MYLCHPSFLKLAQVHVATLQLPIVSDSRHMYHRSTLLPSYVKIANINATPLMAITKLNAMKSLLNVRVAALGMLHK